MTIKAERFFRGAIAVMLLCFCALFALSPGTCLAQSVDDGLLAERKAESENFFRKRVTPFIKTYCLECHQNSRPTEAGLSFTPALDAPGQAAFSAKWKKSAARVKAHDMPPDGSEQPTDKERQMFMKWLEKVKYLSTPDPGAFVIRRLTKSEYGNTLRDLFGVDPKIADALPDEVSGEGYLNSISPLQIEQYLAITQEVLDQILPNGGEYVRPAIDAVNQRTIAAGVIDLSPFVQPPAPGANAQETVRSVAQSLAKKVYRRPASDTELKVLVDVFDLGQQNGLSYQDALRLMLKGMLVSPQFLFITPVEDFHDNAEIVPLDDYQLASRLSYLLWATLPDDELRALADAGKLQEPSILETQVKRMLQDARSRALFDGFGAQWLGIGDLSRKAFDPAMFLKMTSEMRLSMVDEVRSMLDLVLGGARDFRRNLPPTDQRKLEEYLDSVRSVERRIAAIEQRQKEAAMEKAGIRSSRRNDSDSPPIEIKIPEGDRRSEYMRVMCDLNVLAFQTDTTRVSTYIGSTPNGVSYPELGFNDQHHSTTHHNNHADKIQKVAAITTFNIEQFAYMVNKMHSLREGEGTLLDNCIMMWGSGLEDGDRHTRANLPLIIAGKGGGSINTGRYLPDVKGNQGDLLTTLLACAGVPTDRPVGIATKQITEMVASS